MRNRHTRPAAAFRLFIFHAALCLCAAGAAAQAPEEPAEKFEPTAAQLAEAARLRGALGAAVGEHFEVARERLTRRSNWHGGQVYWLAHLRARRPGGYHVSYRYRYKDHVRPRDPLYTFVEHKTFVSVGERGCRRRPRYNSVCVGDTLILPVLFGDYTEHAFWLESQPYTPGDPSSEKARRAMEDDALHREPDVHNPAAEFMRYVGRRAHYGPHRRAGYTMTFEVTFEAVKPGSFNLAVGPRRPADGAQTPAERAAAGPVPVVVVAPGEPVTVLSSKEYVRGYTERFSSNSGNSYLTTPVVLQVGERLTLQYLSYSHRGRPAGVEDRNALEASVKDHPVVVTLLPFSVDPARDYNEWIVDFLPPARRE